MSDDELRRIFGRPVEPLAPPEGHFELIAGRASRRRAARVLAAAAAVVFVALAGVAGTLVLRGPGSTPVVGGGSRSPQPVASPSASVPPSASPSAAALPAGGPVPAGFQPLSVTGVGGGMEYLLGSAACGAGGGCAALVRSTDGGQTWAGLPIPKNLTLARRGAIGPPAVAVSDVRFADPKNGWLFGGALYATHDGGATWTKLDPGGTVQALETNGSQAYAIVADCNVQGGGCQNPRILAAASVQGNRWTEQPATRWAGSGSPAASMGRDYLSLGGGSGLAGVGGRLFALNGQTWRPVTVPGCGGRPWTGSAAASGRASFAICGPAASGTLHFMTYQSVDGGVTWRSAGGSTSADLVSLAAASPSRLVLVASSGPGMLGTAVMSTDGGRTWRAATLPKLAGGWWYVGARSATDLVALPYTPDGSIWTSKDGGTSWQAYRFPAS